MAGRGRPTKFVDPIRKAILKLAEQGYTDEQISQQTGISLGTLKTWKAKYPDFLAALNERKNIADEMVVQSLFKRATGYSHPAVKILLNGKTGQVVEHPYIEHYPPDTVAAIFWLKNRRPDLWRDVQQKDVNVNVNKELPTIEEARQILEADYATLPAPEVDVDDL